MREAVASSFVVGIIGPIQWILRIFKKSRKSGSPYYIH